VLPIAGGLCLSAGSINRSGKGSWFWWRSASDLFDIVLIQIKGGSARGPTQDDCRRLREVKRSYRAKDVVQFQWRKGRSSKFFVLGRNLNWRPSSSEELFQ
jgi:hypothetical protein